MKAHRATMPKGAGLPWGRFIALASILLLALVVVAPAAEARPRPSGSMRVNGGAPFTGLTTVTITSSFSGVTKMQFRDAGGAWSAWEPYSATKVWTLPAGDGLKTVEAQYKSTGKATSKSASITLDTTAPVTANDYSGPAGRKMTICLTATDALSGVGLTEYRVDGGPWQTGTTITLLRKIKHKAGGLEVGAHLVEYRSTDVLGTVEADQGLTVTLL